MANSLGGQQNFFQQFQGQYNMFMKNPIGFLAQRKINIPQQFQNDPKAAVQNMLNNGQMTQEQLNQMMQIAKQAGINLS